MISLKEIREMKLKGKANSNRGENDPVIENIPIDMIRPNPYQPRKNFTEQSLQELCESIKQYGLLQPITVRKMSNHYYELIAGERRLRASKMAGMTQIPAIIMNAYEQDSAIIALIENLQRENLHYMEEAEGYYNLIKDHGFTQEDLAKKLGKNQSTVANKLRLLKLPIKVKEMLKEGNLTERHARALLRIHDEEAQLKILGEIIRNNLNVKKTEEKIEKYLEKLYEKKEDKEKKKKVLRIYRDYRIFINTMKSAVRSMKEAGVSAQYFQEDRGDTIEIRVVIPKG